MRRGRPVVLTVAIALGAGPIPARDAAGQGAGAAGVAAPQAGADVPAAPGVAARGAPPPGAASAIVESAPPVPRPVAPRPGRDPVLRRDPFRPFALAREQVKQRGKGTPLQQYQVGQLRLVGVIEDGKPTAIVEDDQRNGFLIGLGTEIGPNGGVVTAIRGRQVTVVEWETDIVGEKHKKEYVLQMPEDEQPAGPGPRG